jgi:hypothetical protein
MDIVFGDFKRAYGDGLGYDLSMTLSPVAPPDQPNRLRAFFRSTNYQSAKKDFQYRIMWDKSNGFIFGADEGNGWVEIYLAYWKAVGEILAAEEATQTNAKVGNAFISIKSSTHAVFRITLSSAHVITNVLCALCILHANIFVRHPGQRYTKRGRRWRISSSVATQVADLKPGRCLACMW